LTSRLSLLALCFCLFVACLSARAETVALTTGQDDPPFTDSRRADGGVATRLVLEAFRTAGAQPKLDWLPWKRGYSLTKSGTYQASFPYLRTAKREQDFFFSEPIFSDPSYLWIRAGDTLSADQAEGFKGRTICVPQSYHSPLQDLLAAQIASGKVKVERPETPDKCVRMLAAGRVDALSGEDEEIVDILKTLGQADRISRGATPLATLDFHVIFPRDTPGSGALLDRFNAALRRMKEDGRYATLMAR